MLKNIHVSDNIHIKIVVVIKPFLLNTSKLYFQLLCVVSIAQQPSITRVEIICDFNSKM